MSSLRRYAPFNAALACGLVTLLVVLRFLPHLAVQASANAFFVIYLLFEYIRFHRFTPAYLKKHAASTDEPAWVIVVVTFGAVMVAVGSLFLLLNRGTAPETIDLVLSLISVALGWISIHTMTAMHYAHLYWQPATPPDTVADGKSIRKGLDFPGDDEPGIYDFLYYSLVIGMTAQTADVNITKTRMRKLTMVHSMLSFFFNTVLVAAAVNVVVSLAAP